MDAVKQWHYQPYVIEGQAVDVQTTIKLDFAPSAH
jgi:outer membrane biosynthesis protein TonB